MKLFNNIFLEKKILIYGLGKSGISSYKFLKNKSDVYLFDDNQKIKIKLKKKIIKFEQIQKINFDRIIISPGIDISNCKLSNFLKKNSKKIYTDLDVLFSFYNNESITITGTNGKSTTAKILHDALIDQKRDSRLIGNIGNPALSEKNITKKTIFVIEASSYQLDYSSVFRSKYAIILNITADHIERHKSLKNYVNAKFKLLKSQIKGSFAYVKKEDELITKKLSKNKYSSKIYRVQTLSIDKKFNKITNKYFLSDGNKENLLALEKAGLTCFDMELMPRITRAQSMDIISSQSNLAGYKAVLDAASQYGSVFPMMMTAAGTIAPARAFIMGVGVAGLQSIATAKRLGAIVSATDVRPATKEQIESLGAKFLEIDAEMEKDAQTESGHAKQMPPEYFKKQKQIVSEHIKKQDIVITTALIPGRPAPVLVTEDMVKSMKSGSVIVDLAVGAGGNCPISEQGKIVEKYGVKIIGFDNFPGRLPRDSSNLFATNLFNFITPHINNETNKLDINWEDETITGTCITHKGKVIHPMLLASKP